MAPCHHLFVSTHSIYVLLFLFIAQTISPLPPCSTNCAVPYLFTVDFSKFGQSCFPHEHINDSRLPDGLIDPCDATTVLPVVTKNGCSTIDLAWIEPYYIHISNHTSEQYYAHVIFNSSALTIRCSASTGKAQYCIPLKSMKTSDDDLCYDINHLDGFG
jgi:hypothetical protein